MLLDQFLSAIRKEVEDSAARGVIENLENPPGRSPERALLEISEWFRALPKGDREMVMAVARDSAHSAVFGFLCVLDGVRPIEDGPSKGTFELWHAKDGERVLLNSEGNNLMHDEYNAT